MERLKEYIFDKISAMQREKEEAHIEPSLVPYKSLLLEIEKDVRKSLNELYADGRISVSNLLNDKAITIKKADGTKQDI